MDKDNLALIIQQSEQLRQDLHSSIEDTKDRAVEDSRNQELGNHQAWVVIISYADAAFAYPLNSLNPPGHEFRRDEIDQNIPYLDRPAFLSDMANSNVRVEDIEPHNSQGTGLTSPTFRLVPEV